MEVVLKWLDRVSQPKIQIDCMASKLCLMVSTGWNKKNKKKIFGIGQILFEIFNFSFLIMGGQIKTPLLRPPSLFN